MKTLKKLGIWMDHASAHLMPFANEVDTTTTIDTEYTHEEKQESRAKGEKLMHNKEQGEQAAFYEKLGEIIKTYDSVLLFGPTNAKTELFNILKADDHFKNINIEIKQSDKMSENQEHAFVRDHFSAT
jgi:hypothetical protein